MIFIKNNKIVGEEEKLANMNKYFINVTTHLKPKLMKLDLKTNLESIKNILQKHESLQRIKLSTVHSKCDMKFKYVSALDAKKEISNFSSEKTTRKDDIPAKILKKKL